MKSWLIKNSSSIAPIGSPPDTLISSPVPFERTSPEWKLALLNYLVGMKASGYNIAAVGDGDGGGGGDGGDNGGNGGGGDDLEWEYGMVRKKVGHCMATCMSKPPHLLLLCFPPFPLWDQNYPNKLLHEHQEGWGVGERSYGGEGKGGFSSPIFSSLPSFLPAYETSNPLEILSPLFLPPLLMTTPSRRAREGERGQRATNSHTHTQDSAGVSMLEEESEEEKRVGN